MAEETKTTAASEAPAAAAEVVVSDVPAVVEKEATVTTPQPEPEPVPEAEAKSEKPAEEAAVESLEAEAEKAEEKIAESASFKEETNVVEQLPDPQKKAIDEFKQLIQEALNKHEFTAPPPPPPAPAKEEEKKPEPEAQPSSATEEVKPVEEGEKKEFVEESKVEEKKEEVEVPPPVAEEPPKPEAETVVEAVEETKEVVPPPPSEPAPAVAEKVEEKAEAEEIKETIVEVTTPPPPAPAPDEAAAPVEGKPPKEEPKEEVPEEPKAPEEVSIWGIPLLADERSDVILLKFLRARDFKVKDAFTMLKNVVAWRKEFGIEDLLEEEGIGNGLEKVVYMHGVGKEGHPVCYNAFGEFQDKELYQNAFADAENRSKFLRWRIQFLEKSIRKLDFTPDGINTIVQVNDLKNSPGLFLFKKELRQATNQALQLLQDNYPEFVAKQVFINVPWWYVAYNRMISPFLTTRTKSKFVFAGPSKTAETLFKYIAPEQVPVQYGGLSREGEQEFTIAEPATEETIMPSSKQAVEFPVTELDSKHEAANAYADAAHCYKKKNIKESISCLEQSVNLFLEIGRLNMSARYYKEIAELYEQEQNLEQTIVYYERAADLFQSEDVNTSANQCRQKIAQFASQLEQYPKAIEIYEDIARQSLNNNLLKYGVKGHLLNAGICQLCKGDVVAINNALERYQELDPTFSGTREYRLLADLAAAIDEEDVAKFTDAVKEYDNMTQLDAWKTTLLLRVKEALKAKELEEDDLT